MLQTTETNLDENGEVKSEDQFVEVEGAIKTTMDESDHGTSIIKKNIFEIFRN